MSHNGFDVNGVLISNMTFANGSEEANMAPMITDFHKRCVERIIVARPGQRIGIENVEIQTLSAFHKDPNAMGFKLITPEFTLTYSGDTKYSKELIEQYKKSDIIVLNVVHPQAEKAKDADNLSFDDAVKILQKTQPKLAVITHFGKRMIDEDPLNEAREIQKLTGVQVLAAIDGMSINPVSYSADAKQKTLGTFSSAPSSPAKDENSEEAAAEEEITEEESEKKESQSTLVNDSEDENSKEEE